MAERLPPIGFWSYARQDDDAEGRLSSLRSVLSFLLQTQYGRDPIRIFQDVAAIPPGAEWEEKIRGALNDSTFFIPIVTPSFIQSQWCNEEFFIFREREQDILRRYPELKGHRRIFPIYYVDIENIDAFDPRLVPELRRLQWLDFRNLIFEDFSHAIVKRPMSTLASSIRNLLLLKVGVAGEGSGARPEPAHAAVAQPERPPTVAASPSVLERAPAEPAGAMTYETLKKVFSEQRPALSDAFVNDVLWTVYRETAAAAPLTLSYEKPPHYDVEATFEKGADGVTATVRASHHADGSPMNTAVTHYSLVAGAWQGKVIRSWQR